MSDMDHLEWKASQRACYALTYVVRPNSEAARVVTLNDPNALLQPAAARSCACDAPSYPDARSSVSASDQPVDSWATAGSEFPLRS